MITDDMQVGVHTVPFFRVSRDSSNLSTFISSSVDGTSARKAKQVKRTCLYN